MKINKTNLYKVFLGIVTFVILFTHNYSFAQNEKIKMSEIIYSIYFSEKGLNRKDQNEKMVFIVALKQEAKIPKLNNIIILDNSNDNKFEIIYKNEVRKIKKRLKALKRRNDFKYANILAIEKLDSNEEFVRMTLNVGMTDYEFFKQGTFNSTYKGDNWEIEYKSIENKWIIDHIDRI